ncbi:MAG: dienelactone hydrolase [Pseudomonadales bacterium]|nr:dienelactone hydrolase [Pseudomonadales bacterium]
MLMVTVLPPQLFAQSNRIDLVRPDAPAMTAFGDYAIGVRTLHFTDPDRPDIVNTVSGAATVRYDRTLTVELWYPATLSAGQEPGGQYVTSTRNTAISATLTGRAVRNAEPVAGQQRFPLVIISHGYPGNRYLLSHLGENLASKGYIVASIDHLESTYTDQQEIASTLYHRAPDQRFVLDQVARLGEDPGSFLYQTVAADRTAVVGYSMGGYGLINNLGAAYSPAIVDLPIAPPNRLLAVQSALNPDFRDHLDARIRAGVAIAPWGMNNGVWRPVDLRGIRLPTLYVSGSVDTTAGYANGTREIFELAANSDRYLLTFVNAGHSAGAPIPVPVELLTSGDGTGVGHYTDPVWDTLRMNNIMDHFIAAFLDLNLKGLEDRRRFLELPENSEDGWTGFEQGAAIGLKLEHLAPAERLP